MKALIVVWLMLLSSAVFSASNSDVDCYYPHKAEQAMAEHTSCGELSDAGKLTLRSDVLERMLFPDSGLECLLLSQGGDIKAYYVKTTGQTLVTLFVDNGCDSFEEGLARTYVDGKIAYFDRSLNIKLLTDFEQGQSFSYAHAVVCNGTFVEETVGEHVLQSGGQCGLIDHDGTLVVPASYPLEQQEVFTTYINSHNECEPPPIQTEIDALCHGRRHARMLDYHSDNWSSYQVREEPFSWQIEFVQAEEPGQALIMEIDKASAHWRSIVPKE